MTDEGKYAKGYDHGYRDGKADTLATTPAPPSVRESLKRLGLPQTKGRIPPEIVHPAPFEDDFLATPAPLDGHQTPGEFHDYRVACVKCGEPGFLHVSWRPEKAEEKQ